METTFTMTTDIPHFIWIRRSGAAFLRERIEFEIEERCGVCPKFAYEELANEYIWGKGMRHIEVKVEIDMDDYGKLIAEAMVKKPDPPDFSTPW